MFAFWVDTRYRQLMKVILVIKRIKQFNWYYSIVIT